MAKGLISNMSTAVIRVAFILSKGFLYKKAIYPMIFTPITLITENGKAIKYPYNKAKIRAKAYEYL